MPETDTQSIFDAVQGINTRLDNIDIRFDKFDERFDKVDGRLDIIEKDLSELKEEVKTWSGRIFNLYNGAFITIALGLLLYIITKAVQL